MRLVIVVASFCLGIVLAGFAGLAPATAWAWTAWGLVTAAALTGVILARVQHFNPVLFAAILLLMLGLARGSAIPQESNGIGVPDNETQVIVEGILLDDPGRAGSSIRLELAVDSVQVLDPVTEEYMPAQSADFNLFLYADRLEADPALMRDNIQFIYGDRYSAEGDFREPRTEEEEPLTEEDEVLREEAEAEGEERPFDGIIFANFVQLQPESGGNPIRRAVAHARYAIAEQLTVLLPGDVGGLAAAVTVGERRFLSQEATDQFRMAGLAHIISISGLHLSLIGGMALGLALAIFGRRRHLYLIAAFAIVWTYATFAGLNPPVMRAAIMFSVFLLARLSGRQSSALPAIAAAAMIMVAIDPAIISSASFLLSFTAVIGVVLFAGAAPLARLAEREFKTPYQHLTWRLSAWAAIGLAASIGATLLTAPVVLATFGMAPLLGPVATLVAVPVLPILIIPALFAGILGLAWEPLGIAFAWPSIVAGEYILVIGSAFAQAEEAVLNAGPLPALFAAAWYAAVAALIFRRHAAILARNTARALAGAAADRRQALPAVITLAAIAAASWIALTGASHPGILRIHFPLISIGDLIIIETPNGQQVLVDGARRRDEAVQALDSVLPFWDNSVDIVVATHPDADHIGGLSSVLDRYTVDYVLDADIQHSSSLSREWRGKIEALEESKQIELIDAKPGTEINLGDVILKVLWAGQPSPDVEANDASIVILLEYGEFRALLTGDITTSVERTLSETEEDLRATLLKVAHHGSDTSSAPQFLEAVSPDIAVIQVGIDNRFGHPDCVVLENLRQAVPEDDQVLISGTLSPELQDQRECSTTPYSGGVTVLTNGRDTWIQSDD